MTADDFTVEMIVEDVSATVTDATSVTISMTDQPLTVVVIPEAGPPGTPGPGGAGSVVINAPLAGIQNGTNLVFTTPDVFLPNSTGVFRNGLRERRGIDYTEAPNFQQVLFTTAPLATDSLTADYTVE